MSGFEKYQDLMPLRGKHKVGKSCTYSNKLRDAYIQILSQLIDASYQYLVKTQMGCYRHDKRHKKIRLG
ncbi:MAG: hypothetical protein ACI8ZO_001721 [Flavobacteriales bacterium]|jgi:hypothetical protein